MGLHTLAGALEQLAETPLSSILHWNQPPLWYFTKSRRTKVLLADPDKELVVYSKKDMEVHWVSTHSNGEEKGIALFLA